jgi:hypothetical protein
MTIENPIFPPEGEGGGQRYESANLNIEELERFLGDTVFEDKGALKEILTGRYHIKLRTSFEEIQMGMTRKFKGVTLETLEKLERGEEVEENRGEPLSGVEPESVLALDVTMKDDKKASLEIFKVFNRNDEYRFEYVLHSGE